MYGLITIVLFNMLLMLRHVLGGCPSCVSSMNLNQQLSVLFLRRAFVCLYLHRLIVRGFCVNKIKKTSGFTGKTTSRQQINFE